MTILVTGATGTVGRHVTEQLARRGVAVRALTRNPGRARSMLPEGVEIVAGDLMRPDTLREAVKGAEAMFLIVSSDEPMADLSTDPGVVRLAADAGVKRVAVLVGFEEGLVEEAVRESGMAWTLLKPVEFMANVLADWGPSIREEGVVRELNGDAPSARVHEGDIAAVAVEALTGDGHHGKRYVLTGPEVLTRREAVRAVAAGIGKEIAFIELKDEEARTRWREQGYDEESIGFFMQMAYHTPEVGRTVLPTVEQVLGRPARTLAEWAAEHRHLLL